MEKCAGIQTKKQGRKKDIDGFKEKMIIDFNIIEKNLIRDFACRSSYLGKASK